MQELSLVNDDFTYYGVSSMNVRLYAGLFPGCRLVGWRLRGIRLLTGMLTF